MSQISQDDINSSPALNADTTPPKVRKYGEQMKEAETPSPDNRRPKTERNDCQECVIILTTLVTVLENSLS